MTREQVPIDFDLPTKLTTGSHHVPHKGFGTEINLRRSHPRGWLVARQERNGLLIAITLLERLENPVALAQARELAAVCLFGSAWHTYAEANETNEIPEMRRRLKLKRYDTLQPDERPDTLQASREAIRYLQDTVPHADRHMISKDFHRADPLETTRRQRGQRLGNGALLLAGADVGNLIVDNPWLDNSEIQTVVRDRSKQVLAGVSALGNTLAATPSLAQLAEPDSALAVMTRTTAPEELHFVYKQALEEFARAT